MNLVLFNNTWLSKASTIVNDYWIDLIFFDRLEGEKISAMLPRSWKKLFYNGIVIPAKMRRCDECNDKVLCMTCSNQLNKNREFEANSKLLRWQFLINLVVYVSLFERTSWFNCNSSLYINSFFPSFYFFSFFIINECYNVRK